MKASIVDLRYKMKDVLNALDRNEEVKVLYHGKLKGTIIPQKNNIKKSGVKDHPFFGMNKDEDLTVPETLDKLRKNRYHDI
jgi:hypothetical protein